jgi:hypothetical protein
MSRKSKGKGPQALTASEPTPSAEREVAPKAAEVAASTAPVPMEAKPEAAVAGPLVAAWRIWGAAYRVELILFAVSYLVLASFSSQRFLRQSEAPHFVYQAKGWLDGRLDLDFETLYSALGKNTVQRPILEDWACVREVAGQKVRCEGDVRPTDRWYSSFPWFPAVVMMPFVALHGYQFNDTSFGVLAGALAVAAFYSLLRRLARENETDRDQRENIALALMLAFGSLFFYCAIRGEVWFSAEVMGVGLTCLYVKNALGARRPLLSGLFFSMAVLTRAPLLFTGLFFLIECLAPGPTGRLAQLKTLGHDWKPKARKLGLFAAGAAPLALVAALYNYVRFGAFGEFGHRFFYWNRVNADIDQYGLFNLRYLRTNLEAAFLKLPDVSLHPLRLAYDPHGLTLLLTLPLLVFLLVPKERRRLHWPLWLTVGACALPGLFYMNDGYMQFGFRFSIDYTPYLLLLFAIGGWRMRNRWVMAASTLGVLVNFWGAVAFRGYTELVRNW